MIQVYNRDNTDYTKNGDCVLFPETAEVHVILNGAWEATLEHPLDPEGRWKYLTEEAVVKMPSFNGEQLFRIRKPYKSDTGVTCTMEPIFYDSRSDKFLEDVRPEKKNGQEALNILCTGKYHGISDILTKATAYYEYKNLLSALVGDEDNSFINRWGGEAIFDNYTVRINARAGGDYNVEIRYGKNLPEDGMSVELDMATVTTRIYPKAYNGYMMTNHGYVDSPLINNYALVYANTITYSDVKMREDAQEDDELNGIIVCDTQAELDAALRTKCEEEFDAGADKPDLTIEADLILLQNTEQYADIADLETVSLGDTIHCYNSHLGFSTNARVMELTYNCLKKRVENVTLGAYKESYFDALMKGLRGIDELAQRANSALAGDGSVIAEKIKGVLNGSMAMIRTQYNIAERQDVLAILFENLDPTSDMFGALGIGTQGIMISKKRNQDNTDWVWTTAITALGAVADVIVTGLLADAAGHNYWNLDTGEFQLASTTAVGDTTIGDIAEGNGLTQEMVFNKLTKNGTVQGIYLTSEGKLYIAGEFMQIGKISSKNGRVYFDLDNNEIAASTLKSPTKLSGGVDTILEVGSPYGSSSSGSIVNIYPSGYKSQSLEISTNTSGDASISSSGDLDMRGDSVEYWGSSFGINGNSGSLWAYVRSNVTNERVEIYRNLSVDSAIKSTTLTCSGTKSRETQTENYEKRLLYCYEMPSPMFGDIGDGATDEEGIAVISIDDIFAETIRGDLNYQVFLQKCGPGELWVEERTPSYFVVKGTPNMKFSWELKAKQAGYETERLEREEYLGYTPYLQTPEELLDSELSDLIMEQEAILYETA